MGGALPRRNERLPPAAEAGAAYAGRPAGGARGRVDTPRRESRDPAVRRQQGLNWRTEGWRVREGMRSVPSNSRIAARSNRCGQSARARGTDGDFRTRADPGWSSRSSKARGPRRRASSALKPARPEPSAGRRLAATAYSVKCTEPRGGRRRGLGERYSSVSGTTPLVVRLTRDDPPHAEEATPSPHPHREMSHTRGRPVMASPDYYGTDRSSQFGATWAEREAPRVPSRPDISMPAERGRRASRRAAWGGPRSGASCCRARLAAAREAFASYHYGFARRSGRRIRAPASGSRR